MTHPLFLRLGLAKADRVPLAPGAFAGDDERIARDMEAEPRFRTMTPFRQLKAYALVGVAASLAHYSVLIGLKEGLEMKAVPATLIGYVVGGFVSYGLNRRHTFGSERPHREATWRFAFVAFVGFCLTYVLMSLFVERLGAPYLPAQCVTTILAMFVTYFANKLWTFASP